MKTLSKVEFDNECQRLQFRGKCAVLLHKNKRQNINKIDLVYKHYKLINIEKLEGKIDKSNSGVLINLEISPEFRFYKMEYIMNELFKYISNDINVVLTATYDETKEIDEANIVLVISKRLTFKNVFIKLFK